MLGLAMTGASHPVRPPVVTETFNAVSCPVNASSTLELEACAERRLLSSDTRINVRTATIFRKLRTRERSRFVDGEKAWLRYRKESCVVQISGTVGGSGQSLRQLACELARNRNHLSELNEMLMTLRTR